MALHTLKNKRFLFRISVKHLFVSLTVSKIRYFSVSRNRSRFRWRPLKHLKSITGFLRQSRHRSAPQIPSERSNAGSMAVYTTPIRFIRQPLSIRLHFHTFYMKLLMNFYRFFARNNYINIFVFKLSKKNSKKLFTFFSKHDMMILC